MQKFLIFGKKRGSMENELIEILKSVIRALIVQEVRLSRLGQASPSRFVIREMRQSILESKRQVIELVKRMEPHERNPFVKRIIDQSLEEEIDLAIEARRNKCLRCIHMKYVDEEGLAYYRLPRGKGRIESLGCQKMPPVGTPCREYIEKTSAARLDEYLSEISFFYEVKEMFDRMEEIWRDYLTR